jgi:hypothetical protein
MLLVGILHRRRALVTPGKYGVLLHVAQWMVSGSCQPGRIQNTTPYAPRRIKSCHYRGVTKPNGTWVPIVDLLYSMQVTQNAGKGALPYAGVFTPQHPEGRGAWGHSADVSSLSSGRLESS